MNVLTLGSKICHIQHEFGAELVSFCREGSLIIMDMELRKDIDIYTFYSEAQNTTSWLDLVICTLLPMTLWIMWI